jgi:hypothetical protein
MRAVELLINQIAKISNIIAIIAPAHSCTQPDRHFLVTFYVIPGQHIDTQSEE